MNLCSNSGAAEVATVRVKAGRGVASDLATGRVVPGAGENGKETGRRNGFARLSAKSRQMRFLSVKNELSIGGVALLHRD